MNSAKWFRMWPGMVYLNRTKAINREDDAKAPVDIKAVLT